MAESMDPDPEIVGNKLALIGSNISEQINRHFIYENEKGADIFLITKSDVIGFGRNYKGRLGFGHSKEVKERTTIPQLHGKCVIDIKCGDYFSVALTESGQIYTFGLGSRGRTGRGDNNEYHEPQEISIDSQGLTMPKICAIDCTNHANYVLTQNGHIYWFGESVWNGSWVNTPTRVVMPSDVKINSISCGFAHIFALTNRGLVYSWGLNSSGQLGQCHSNQVFGPQMINFNIPIEQISCGYNHSLILTTDGNIYSMGNNCSGQLGIGNKTNQNRLKLVLSRQKKICCHKDISMSMDNNNQLLYWGDIDDGVVSPIRSESSSFEEVINDKYSSLIKVFDLLKPTNSVIQTTTRMCNNPENCGCLLTFKVKRNEMDEQFVEIYAHKCFLREYSEYYRAMFDKKSNWNENISNEIIITNYSPEGFKLYMKSIYTGDVNCKDIETLVEVYKISEQQLNGVIKAKCVQ